MIQKFFVFTLLTITANSIQSYNTDLLTAKPAGNGISLTLHPVTRCLYPKAPCRLCYHHKNMFNPFNSNLPNLDPILSDPEKTLRTNKKLQEKLNNKYKTVDDSFEFFTLKYELENNPIALLGENDQDTDAFSRLTQPHRRNFCEDKTIKRISSTYPHKRKQLVYTSLGRGDLFSDALILSKLIKKGFRKININIIDQNLADYITTMRSCTLQHAAVPFKVTQTDDTKTITDALYTYRFAQFLWALSNLTEGTLVTTKIIPVTINLTLYANTQDYLQDCAHNQATRSDVLVSELQNTQEFSDLMRETLSIRGLAFAYSFLPAEPSFSIFKVTYQRIPAQGTAYNDLQRVRVYDLHDMDAHKPFSLKNMLGISTTKLKKQ
jgi:hypothetical protein